jgi:hypothetical protein
MASTLSKTEGISMKTKIIACLLVFALFVPAGGRAMDKGGYMTWGIICTIATLGMGTYSYSNFQLYMDESDQSAESRDRQGVYGRNSALSLLGTLFLGYLAADCFNHAMKNYGAFLNYRGEHFALGIQDVEYSLVSNSMQARVFTATF